MFLKRIYKTDGWVKQVNAKKADGTLTDPSKPEGECLNPPPLHYIALAHTGTKPGQNFTPKRVMEGVREGYVRFDKETIVFDVHPEPLVYSIVRHPGIYCVHCGKKLADGRAGLLHVQSDHPGKDSPDKNFPTGIRVAHSYECLLSKDQHEKFRLRNPVDAIVPKFHLKEVSHG